MKISCPSCAAKYSIADDKVQSRLAKIRCRKCGTTIVIDGKVDPPSVYAADAAGPAESPPAAAPSAAGAGREYSIDFGDNDQRNLSLPDLIAAYNAGEINAETYVWAEGMGDWAPLGEVAEIVDALHAAAGAPEPEAAPEPAPAPAAPAYADPAPAPQPAFTPGPAADPFGGAAAPEPAASPWGAAPSAPRAAAVGRASAADLFGSFDSAGSESDVTTSAPQPDLGSAAGGAAATGARNESSVLFSLSALTATREPSHGSSSGGGASSSATREDSGLIDLKALTSQADTAGPAVSPLAPSPLGFAPPLGVSPLGAHAADGMLASPTAMPEKKSKMGLFIGAGLLLGCVVIALAIVATSGKDPVPVAAPAPVPTPTAAPEPTPEPTVAAKPPATGTAEGEDPEAAPTAKKPVATGGRRPVQAGPKPAAGPAPAAAPKPTPKPAANPCGCAPGDLQCAMRCAAGG